jgi:hypothetical protein
VSQLVKKLPTFHETQRFFAAFISANYPYPEPVQSNPWPPKQFLYDQFKHQPPIHDYAFQEVFFPRLSPGTPCMLSSSTPQIHQLSIYRVIKISLCTSWLQYRKLQVMFKVSPASLQTFIDTPNCVLKDRVQYSTVHIPNVFCDGHLQIFSCTVL